MNIKEVETSVPHKIKYKSAEKCVAFRKLPKGGEEELSLNSVIAFIGSWRSDKLIIELSDGAFASRGE